MRSIFPIPIKKEGAEFLTEKTNSYLPSDAVVLTQAWNSAENRYDYTVDYSTPYNSGVVYIMNKKTGESSENLDRQYMAYKFDLSEMADLTSAKLQLHASKVNLAGSMQIYSATGTWDEEFGTTGVKKGGTDTFADDSAFPVMGDMITSLSIATSNTSPEIDISQYLISKQEAGEDYAIIYVVYHRSSNSKKTDFNGFRLYNMGAGESQRPSLAVSEISAMESITASGKIYGRVYLPDKPGVPVIAFYKENADGTLILQTAKIGVETDKTVKEIDIDITFAEGEKPVVKLFVWDSISKMVPQMTEKSISTQ